MANVLDENIISTLTASFRKSDSLFAQLNNTAIESAPFIQYGTAGFRTLGNILPPVVSRVAVLSVLRSKKLGKAVGVMVTASHNPEKDNGLKMVDPMGEMLSMEWEEYATRLGNAGPNAFDVISDIIAKESIDIGSEFKVFVGFDTRASSQMIFECISDTVKAFIIGNNSDESLVSIGQATTPQLHFAVRKFNMGLPWDTQAYISELSDAFVKYAQKYTKKGGKPTDITVDASNGVGSIPGDLLSKRLAEYINITQINTNGILNHMVGADYVKVSQKYPQGIDPSADIGKKLASVDGDADRLVYYYLEKDQSGQIQTVLLDGSKICALMALFVQEHLSILKSEGARLGVSVDISLGVVQTAYSNGSFTKYINETFNLETHYAKTGVKYLHAIAEEFDIGIYFEANGHGTVLFKETTAEKILGIASQMKNLKASDEAIDTIDSLLNIPKLINQAVGDAWSDLLFIEAILLYKNWTLSDWNAIYQDLPNRLRTQKVANRNLVETRDAETKVSKPDGFQDLVEAAMSKHGSGRSFVRPSGTEDIVRIYAEASTQAGADALALEVSQLVYDNVGGVGPRPLV